MAAAAVGEGQSAVTVTVLAAAAEPWPGLPPPKSLGLPTGAAMLTNSPVRARPSSHAVMAEYHVPNAST